MSESLLQLGEFIHDRSQIVVITGAGISAASGIPTYRDDEGQWQRSAPIQHQEFLRSASYRKRYWARSAVGWPPVARAQPNSSHHALARLEGAGKLSLLVTQNVDRLHQRAGHKRVIDLHGRLDRVVCLDCGQIESRHAIQQQLLDQNPCLENLHAPLAPDGDADIENSFIQDITCPWCPRCGGIPMPDVVFYGGSVPKTRVAEVQQAVENADGILVVGTSLSVYSVFRFCRAANVLEIPIAAINRGKTRADEMLALKVEQDCGQALEWLVTQIAGKQLATGEKNSEI